MSSEGPLSPANAENDNTIGTINWTSQTACGGEDGVGAQIIFTDEAQLSVYLKALVFGFAIPADAVIRGIKVEIKRGAADADTIEDNSVRIVKSDTIQSDEKAIAGAWPAGSFVYEEYGGETDLWDETWTPSDINADDFGAAISAKPLVDTTCGGEVDHVRITVYYGDPDGLIAAVASVVPSTISGGQVVSLSVASGVVDVALTPGLGWNISQSPIASFIQGEPLAFPQTVIVGSSVALGILSSTASAEAVSLQSSVGATAAISSATLIAGVLTLNPASAGSGANPAATIRPGVSVVPQPTAATLSETPTTSAISAIALQPPIGIDETGCPNGLIIGFAWTAAPGASSIAVVASSALPGILITSPAAAAVGELPSSTAAVTTIARPDPTAAAEIPLVPTLIHGAVITGPPAGLDESAPSSVAIAEVLVQPVAAAAAGELPSSTAAVTTIARPDPTAAAEIPLVPTLIHGAVITGPPAGLGVATSPSSAIAEVLVQPVAAAAAGQLPSSTAAVSTIARPDPTAAAEIPLGPILIHGAVITGPPAGLGVATSPSSAIAAVLVQPAAAAAAGQVPSSTAAVTTLAKADPTAAVSREMEPVAGLGWDVRPPPIASVIVVQIELLAGQVNSPAAIAAHASAIGGVLQVGFSVTQKPAGVVAAAAPGSIVVGASQPAVPTAVAASAEKVLLLAGGQWTSATISVVVAPRAPAGVGSVHVAMPDEWYEIENRLHYDLPQSRLMYSL